MQKAFVLALLALSGVLAAPAMADADPGDILGTWSFQTQPYRDGQCIMSGTMHLSHDPENEDGVYACELTALEMCSLWGQSIVRQNCEARRFGNQVSIRSEIAEVLERKGEVEGFAFNYVPDNFAVTVKGPKRMFGALVSAVTAPVEFRRQTEGIS